MADRAPRVSVINLARYLPAAIDSALAQDPPGGPVEVIVVDDGSTDETPQVLDAYAGRVRVIRQPKRGPVAAVDRGLTAVTGEYVALLDADDEWPPYRLRRHVSPLDGNPLLGLVHGSWSAPSSTARRGASLVGGLGRRQVREPAFLGLGGRRRFGMDLMYVMGSIPHSSPGQRVALAARQYGHVTDRQLVHTGLSRGAIECRISLSRLIGGHRGSASIA